MHILILDNYDSFTYNLVHLVEQYAVDIDVFRNDAISVEHAGRYDKILLSPGPGLPRDAGVMMELIGRWGDSKSIFGVCLGMQGIVEHYGGRLFNLDEMMHGVSTDVIIEERFEKLFAEVPGEIRAGRYHSWGVRREDVPEALRVTAIDRAGVVMAVSHRKYDIRGVQFHPESIMTDHGKKIIENWINF